MFNQFRVNPPGSAMPANDEGGQIRQSIQNFFHDFRVPVGRGLKIMPGQDRETRLVHCMVELQGFTKEEVTKQKFGSGEKRSDLEALAAYVVAQSRGMPVKVPLKHPKEKAAYALGEKMFFYRGGPHDFACSTCHAESGKRIRLQDLPNLSTQEDARRAYTTWPAYRVSQGEVRSMQWRLYDCFRQQRFPELKFTSDASIALTTFLAQKAQGGVMDAPALKR